MCKHKISVITTHLTVTIALQSVTQLILKKNRILTDRLLTDSSLITDSSPNSALDKCAIFSSPAVDLISMCQ